MTISFEKPWILIGSWYPLDPKSYSSLDIDHSPVPRCTPNDCLWLWSAGGQSAEVSNSKSWVLSEIVSECFFMFLPMRGACARPSTPPTPELRCSVSRYIFCLLARRKWARASSESEEAWSASFREWVFPVLECPLSVPSNGWVMTQIYRMLHAGSTVENPHGCCWRGYGRSTCQDSGHQ